MRSRAVAIMLYFCVVLPPLTFFFVLLAMDGWPVAMGPPWFWLGFAYLFGLSPAGVCGVVYREMVAQRRGRLTRLAITAIAHPVGALPIFLPMALLAGFVVIWFWVMFVPLFAATALACAVLAEFVWTRSCAGSLAGSDRHPT